MRHLVDVHVHFQHGGTSAGDAANRRRLEVGRAMGITVHVASILGTWGATSPTYFPSPDDLKAGNDALIALLHAHPEIRGYATVNPNFTAHALDEITRCRAAGMIGIKLAASRRASDRLLDPIGETASRFGLPVLQHIWQHRRGEVPGQEISDALDLLELAGRHPGAPFILAHIGGGGDWAHSLRALADVPNVFVDLSGSGVDRGMLELCLERVGAARLLWGTDLTMDTGLAKLRALEALGVAGDALEAVRWRTANRIFGLGLSADGSKAKAESRT